jgi:hypothetical protein
MSLREHGAEAAPALSGARGAARPKPRPRPPIDLAHLENETRGLPGRHTELLKLFPGQANEGVARIKSAATLAERREAAHDLVAAARRVGAFSVAYIASEIELARGPVTGRLIALDRAVEAARFFIADLLSE